VSPPEAEDWVRTLPTAEVERQFRQQRDAIEEQARRAAEQRRQFAQFQREAATREMTAAAQAQRAIEQQEQYAQAGVALPPGFVPEYAQSSYEAQRAAYLRMGEMLLVPPPPMVPPQALTEGTPPQALMPTPTRVDPLGQGRPSAVLEAYVEQVAQNKRLAKNAALTPDDARKERARQKIAKALNEAVESGYLTEARAVSMIAAGGLNDQPLSAEGSLDQVVATLAQAVLSGALDRATADTILVMLGRTASSQGQARPVAQPPERAGTLLEQLERRDGLIYDALLLRPCHLAAHAARHAGSVWVCDEQAARAWGTILAGLEIDAVLLPRATHMLNGAQADCCRLDGNVGAWLRWGRTEEPVEESA